MLEDLRTDVALVQRERMSVIAFRTAVVWSGVHPEFSAKIRP